MTIAQRFCPICDRSFEKGEAVLRCEGCGVLHHPGCWVTNNGCATQGPHRAAPSALAYGTEPPAPKEAPHPGEGTRVYAAPPPVETSEPPTPVSFTPSARPTPLNVPERPGAEPTPITSRVAPVVPAVAATEAVDDDEPVIGGPAPAKPVTLGVGPPPATLVSAKKPAIQYNAGPGSSGAMPKIYEGHRLLRYWYIPVAVGLAIAVALGVIWASDQLFGDDGEPAAADPTATPEESTSDPDATEDPAATPPGEATVPPTGGLGVGDTAVVFGTGGECLNVRSAPGTSNEPVTCLEDGTIVTIVDGPSDADGLTWWKISAESGEGWAASDYLQEQ